MPPTAEESRWYSTAGRRNDLDASVGTLLRVAYYEPEVENGKEIERFFDAVVTDIVPITKPATPYRRGREATFDKPPTRLQRSRSDADRSRVSPTRIRSATGTCRFNSSERFPAKTTCTGMNID